MNGRLEPTYLGDGWYEFKGVLTKLEGNSLFVFNRADFENKMKKHLEERFMECDTCRAKPGAPLLCAGCLHNRTLINNLLDQRSKAREQFKLTSPDRPDFHANMKKLQKVL